MEGFRVPSNASSAPQLPVSDCEVVDAPLGLDDYEVLDMQEKYWVWIYSTGAVMAMRFMSSRGRWKAAALDPNALLSLFRSDWELSSPEPSGRLAQVSVADILSLPTHLPTSGVAILSAGGLVARYIEAMPGER